MNSTDVTSTDDMTIQFFELFGVYMIFAWNVYQAFMKAKKNFFPKHSYFENGDRTKIDHIEEDIGGLFREISETKHASEAANNNISMEVSEVKKLQTKIESLNEKINLMSYQMDDIRRHTSPSQLKKI